MAPRPVPPVPAPIYLALKKVSGIFERNDIYFEMLNGPRDENTFYSQFSYHKKGKKKAEFFIFCPNI